MSLYILIPMPEQYISVNSNFDWKAIMINLLIVLPSILTTPI